MGGGAGARGGFNIFNVITFVGIDNVHLRVPYCARVIEFSLNIFAIFTGYPRSDLLNDHVKYN